MNKKVIIRNFSEIEPLPTSHGVGRKLVLLSKQETESTVTQIAKTLLSAGEKVETHVHKTMEEYFIIISGSGKLLVENDSFVIKEQMFISVPADTQHEIFAESDMEMITFGVAVK